MSKRFASTYPNLARAIEKDKVMAITTEDGEGIYITYVKGLTEKEVGRVGYESILENYLIDNPDLMD